MIYLNSVFDQYQELLYLSYQSICKLLFISYSDLNLLFFFLLFILGFLTILTPCFMSLLPIVVTYIYSNSNNKFNKYSFIVGIMNSLVFSLLISNFYIFNIKLPILSSCTLLFISLNLMQIIDFTFVSNFIYMNFGGINNNTKNSYFRSYLIGLLIGISSIPCNSSMVLLVVFLLKQLRSLYILCMFIYLCGCFIPLLLISNIKIKYNNFSFLFNLRESIFPLGGSCLFFFSLLSLLRNSLL